MVLNTHYGGRQFLPFDLSHKAGPIIFDLAPDADKAVRDAVAATLKGQFIVALRPYLQKQGGPLAASSFRPTPSTLSPAVYFSACETLAASGEEEDGDRVEYSYTDVLIHDEERGPTMIADEVTGNKRAANLSGRDLGLN